MAKLAGRVLSGVAGLTVGFGRTAGRATGLVGIDGLTVGVTGRMDGLVTTPGVRLMVLFGIDGLVTEGVAGRVVGLVAGRVAGLVAGRVAGRAAGRAAGRETRIPRASASSTTTPVNGISPQAMDQMSSFGDLFILFFSVKSCYNHLINVGQHDAIHDPAVCSPSVAVFIDRTRDVD